MSPMYVPASPSRTRWMTSPRSSSANFVSGATTASARAMAPDETSLCRADRGLTVAAVGSCEALRRKNAPSASERRGRTARVIPSWIDCARRRELEKGFDQGEEARGRFPERHVPRGGNYDNLGGRQDIRFDPRLR